jgi:hypothetical protein
MARHDPNLAPTHAPLAAQVQTQAQTWSISGFDALRQTFTPTSGPRTRVL